MSYTHTYIVVCVHVGVWVHGCLFCLCGLPSFPSYLHMHEASVLYTCILMYSYVYSKCALNDLHLPLRVNLRYLLSCGMMLSAVMVFLFGSVGPWLKVYSVYYYGVFWGLNGE